MAIHGNVQGSLVPVGVIMARPSFRLGFLDYRKGRPFSVAYDAADDDWQQSYERGRLFAACLARYSDAARFVLTRNGKTTHKAAQVCSFFVRQKWVI